MIFLYFFQFFLIYVFSCQPSSSWETKNNVLPNIPCYPLILDGPYSFDNRCTKSFYLWTKEFMNGQESEIMSPLNICSICTSHFQNRKTYIIVHGLASSAEQDWVMNLKDRLLSFEDSNVITVHWAAGSGVRAAVGHEIIFSKVPYVAKDISLLVVKLMKYNKLRAEDVHFVGHSLGAHISGMASKVFNGTIGRITGLDPAGQVFNEYNETNRLHKSDAQYVDIIHSNACEEDTMADCYGIYDDIGDSDFWPNGGHQQPFCHSKFSSLLDAICKENCDFGCSHVLAHAYYVESFDYPKDRNMFMARPASSYEEYLDGNYTNYNIVNFMGAHVDTSVTGVFYLRTNKRTPFALAQKNEVHFHDDIEKED